MLKTKTAPEETMTLLLVIISSLQYECGKKIVLKMDTGFKMWKHVKRKNYARVIGI